MTDEVVDITELKDRLDGDRDLFLDVAEVFFGDFPVHVEALKNAIPVGNADKIREHAHTVKGAPANLSAKKASAAAFQLELAGKEKKLENTNQLFQNLLDEVKRFSNFADEVKAGKHW